MGAAATEYGVPTELVRCRRRGATRIPLLGSCFRPTDRQPPDRLTAEQQAEQLKAMALADSGQLGVAVNASNQNFVLLDDLEVNSQIAVLEKAIKLRRAWTSQPKTKRDVSVIEKMLKE